MNEAVCPSCGATVEPGSVFCAECGQRLSEPLTRPVGAAQAGDVAHGPAPVEAPTAEYAHPPAHAPAAPAAYGPPAPPPPPPPYGTVVYQSPPPPSGHNAATYVGLGVASVVAVAAVAVAIVLASSSGGGEPQPVGAAQVATTPPTVTIVRETPAPRRARRSSSSGGFVAPPVPRSTRPSSTSSSRLSASTATEVENVVERHWRFIENGNYSAAYDLLAPGTQSRGPWISEHVSDAVSDVDVNVDATINSSTSATVRVLNLRTVANSGCNEWTGFYDMARISGAWRIRKAKISNTPC